MSIFKTLLDWLMMALQHDLRQLEKAHYTAIRIGNPRAAEGVERRKAKPSDLWYGYLWKNGYLWDMKCRGVEDPVLDKTIAYFIERFTREAEKRGTEEAQETLDDFLAVFGPDASEAKADNP